MARSGSVGDPGEGKLAAGMGNLPNITATKWGCNFV
jgi:hypothetical protein